MKNESNTLPRIPCQQYRIQRLSDGLFFDGAWNDVELWGHDGKAFDDDSHAVLVAQRQPAKYVLHEIPA